jgi:hypothetical protein
MFQTFGERIECERKVLSTLLLEGLPALRKLSPYFAPGDFESMDHKKIFKAMVTIFNTDGKYDIKSVSQKIPEYAELIIDITKEGEKYGDDFGIYADKLCDHHLKSELLQSDLTFLNGKEIIQLADNNPSIKDLIKHIIREKSLVFLAGEEGCGKSMLAMNLGLAVAVGAKKFLCWDIDKTGKVLYLNYELYNEDFAGRFKKMYEGCSMQGNIENILAPIKPLQLSESWDALNELILNEKPCLIIIDCFYFAHSEDESSNTKMKAIMKKLLSVRDQYNTCVLVIHHTRKGTQNSKLHNDLMRGAGVFGAATDTVLMMRRSQKQHNVRIIKVTKNRHAADTNLNTRELILDDTLWFQDRGIANEEDHMIDSDDNHHNKHNNENDIKAEILMAIQRGQKYIKNGILTNVDITQSYNDVRSQLEQLTPKKISGFLSELGFKRTIGERGGFAIIWNESILKKCCEQYGIDYRDQSSEPSEKQLDNTIQNHDAEVPEDAEVLKTTHNIGKQYEINNNNQPSESSEKQPKVNSRNYTPHDLDAPEDLEDDALDDPDDLEDDALDDPDDLEDDALDDPKKFEVIETISKNILQYILPTTKKNSTTGEIDILTAVVDQLAKCPPLIQKLTDKYTINDCTLSETCDEIRCLLGECSGMHMNCGWSRDRSAKEALIEVLGIEILSELKLLDKNELSR